jgi:aspartate aminotransferase
MIFTSSLMRFIVSSAIPAHLNISAIHLKGIEDNVILFDSVSKRYNECGLRIGALVTKNEAVRKCVMKFCQARLSPPLIGQIIAEASIDTPKDYMLKMYNEYVERRKFLIDGLNRNFQVFYTPIPMGAFYTVAGCLLTMPTNSALGF